MTQSIIVYRNPLEQQLWEGGYIPPIMIGCVCLLVFFVALMKISSIVFGDRKVNSNPVYTWGAGILAVILTAVLFHFLPAIIALFI